MKEALIFGIVVSGAALWLCLWLLKQARRMYRRILAGLEIDVLTGLDIPVSRTIKQDFAALAAFKHVSQKVLLADALEYYLKEKKTK